jgi:hypothetical protein
MKPEECRNWHSYIIPKDKEASLDQELDGKQFWNFWISERACSNQSLTLMTKKDEGEEEWFFFSKVYEVSLPKCQGNRIQ